MISDIPFTEFNLTDDACVSFSYRVEGGAMKVLKYRNGEKIQTLYTDKTESPAWKTRSLPLVRGSILTANDAIQVLYLLSSIYAHYTQ